MEGQNIEKRSSLYSFFTFKKMTAILFIQILYPIGILGIIGYYVMNLYSSYKISSMMNSFSSAFSNSEGLTSGASLSFSQIIYALFSVIALNLLWRLICEGFIVVFRIHSSLEKIENNTQK